MWKKERDALYYSSKNSGGKRSGVKSRGGGGVKSRTPIEELFQARKWWFMAKKWHELKS